MKIKLTIFTILGAISGWVSFFAFAKINFWAPGWIFGVVISLLLYFFFHKNILYLLLFVGVSTGAFYISVRTYLLFDYNITLSIPMAGLVGSTILAIYLKFIYKLPVKYALIISIVGTLAALPDPDLGIFPIWQTCVALAISYVIYIGQDMRKG